MPGPKVSKRLSPVPVLPPIATGVPSGSVRAPRARTAVPFSTTSSSAARTACATSLCSTRSGPKRRGLEHGRERSPLREAQLLDAGGGETKPIVLHDPEQLGQRVGPVGRGADRGGERGHQRRERIAEPGASRRGSARRPPARAGSGCAGSARRAGAIGAATDRTRAAPTRWRRPPGCGSRRDARSGSRPARARSGGCPSASRGRSTRGASGW